MEQEREQQEGEQDGAVRVGRVTWDTAPSDVEEIVVLFEAIARQEGWQPEGQLRAHQERSVYFTARVGGKLAGGMQVVVPALGEPFPFHAV